MPSSSVFRKLMVNEQTALLPHLKSANEFTMASTSPSGESLSSNEDQDSKYDARSTNHRSAFHLLVGIAIGMGIVALKDFLMHQRNDINGSKGSWNQKMDSSPSKPSMKYSHVQTLGFQIYTGGAPAFLSTNETASKLRDTDDVPIDPAAPDTYKNPECTGRHAYGVLGGWEYMCYTGNDDPIADVTARFGILERALERAYQVSESDDESVLKIFLVPEFYWRGIQGSYELLRDRDERNNNAYECSAICHMLELLEVLVSDERFDDWIFLFGTAIASEKLEGETGHLVNSTSDDYHLFYNFAPIYRGGKRANSRFLLPKRYVSKIDFLTPQRHWSEALAKELIDEPLSDETSRESSLLSPKLASMVPPGDAKNSSSTVKHHKNHHHRTISNPLDQNQQRYDNKQFAKLWREYKDQLSGGGSSYTFIEYGWIMIDDIAMTIEICYDHKRRTALESFLADVVTGSTTRIPSLDASGTLSYVPIPEQQAHVSLVSSAGMQIHPDALALTDGGTIFLQDGLTDLNTVLMAGDIDGGGGKQTVTSTSRAYSSSSSSLAFDGGTEAVRRTAVLAANDVFFEHSINTDFVKHSIFTESEGAWVDAVHGTFSVHSYEPMITAYAPIPIASKRNSFK